MKRVVPDIKRAENGGRTEFESFRELFEYLGAGNESTITSSCNMKPSKTDERIE